MVNRVIAKVCCQSTWAKRTRAKGWMVANERMVDLRLTLLPLPWTSHPSKRTLRQTPRPRRVDGNKSVGGYLLLRAFRCRCKWQVGRFSLAPFDDRRDEFLQKRTDFRHIPRLLFVAGFPGGRTEHGLLGDGQCQAKYQPVGVRWTRVLRPIQRQTRTQRRLRMENLFNFRYVDRK